MCAVKSKLTEGDEVFVAQGSWWRRDAVVLNESGIEGCRGRAEKMGALLSRADSASELAGEIRTNFGAEFRPEQ